MSIDVSVQELNGMVEFYTQTKRGDNIDHIATKMKKRVVLIDESTTISGKSVFVVCLRAAIADTEPDTIFFELLESDGTTAISQRHCCHVFTNMALMTIF